MSQAEMGIHRDNFQPIIVIAQNSVDLSITADIAFVINFVIADKLSRYKRFFVHTVFKVRKCGRYG